MPKFALRVPRTHQEDVQAHLEASDCRTGGLLLAVGPVVASRDR